MKNNYFMIGFSVGIVCVVIVMVIKLIINNKGKAHKCNWEFDERQLKARGKAFQTGFFTSIIAIGIAVIAIGGFGLYPSIYELIVVLMIILSVTVLTTTIQLIWTDCYISFRNSPAPNMILFYILAAVQLILYITEKKEGEPHPLIILIVGIMILTIAINMSIKMLYDKKHLLDDEESNEE